MRLSAARLAIVLAATLVVLACSATAQAYVFWTAGLDGGGATIGRADLNGASVEPAFVGGLASASAIAVDAGHVYWADTVAGKFTIGRANLDGTGADPTWIPNLANSASGILTDGPYIYWTDGDNIARASLDGAGVNQDFISAGTSLSGLALASGTLYTVSSPNILGVPESGGSPQPVVTLPSSTLVFDVTVAGGSLYWTQVANTGTGPGTIATAPLGDLANVNPTFVDGLVAPVVIATDGSYLYWSYFDGPRIGRASISDPGNPNLDFINTPNVQGIAVNAGIDPTTTSVSCLQPSVGIGATTTCTAKVGDTASTAPPTGTVNFTAGNTAVVVGSNPCTLGAIGGVAQCTIGVQPTTAGHLVIQASYGGDALHQPSAGATNLCAGSFAQCNPRPPGCTVPKLSGKTLTQARRLLATAGCTLGRVTKPKAKHGHKPPRLVVGSTKPAAGSKLANGAKVAVKLVVPRSRRHRR